MNIYLSIISLHILYSTLRIPVCSAKDYCSYNFCNNSKQHTLCKFQSTDPARHCVDFERTINTAEDKEAILNKMNSRRQKVASGEIRSLPSADNMMKLEWNKELEVSAQHWANQCVKQTVADIEDTCRDLEGNIPVGQNIASIYGEAPGLTPWALLDIWYMELLNLNSSIISRYKPSNVTGYLHYDYFTQLVWAETSQVGCGGVKFKERIRDGDSENYKVVYRLVCNFAPSGNRLGTSVYSYGTPCSGCPIKTNCNGKFKALCDSNTGHDIEIQHKKVTESENKFQNDVTTILFDKYETNNDKTNQTYVNQKSNRDEDFNNEDNYTPFDYFSHLHEFTRQIFSTVTQNTTSCKDMLAVDEFIELLKKKLSTDPMFKDWLQSTKMMQKGFDGDFTDPGILAIASNIYSKKETTITTTVKENDFVNSTLLADLVEAVIFRKNDKFTKMNNLEEDSVSSTPGVSPIRIQAELGKTSINQDFTGHFFFPEDETEEVIETTESDYEITNYVSVSDVLSEIEDLKRSRQTTNFLDEILESESATENTYISKRNKRRNYLVSIYRKNKYNNKYDMSEIRHTKLAKNGLKSLCSETNECIIIKYSDLLKELTYDIKLLKLNEKYHCSRNNALLFSHKSIKIMLNIIFILILMTY